ncbi:dihydrolipoamide acetyltransferase family protein [Ferroacidibacillus organovorans]|uniref:Dihydrolipoamide acetyltransferase component of pyruvate dehydrogenase complex n=1 Tax=Ferroacidibacillus organovorans TaxID=1765683 RepID=A0A168C5J2_9BACL|nr:dihydrolipoamide acetyltransferase family protein [Ferroacidibacillus organovorans]KYP81564.1 dienelactone hydrolase [Ferroacidibacillus organovorans]OAG94101.1 dienelactone hydrolase [Ferroacidibacillus organovorans]OPG16313.1 dienelactone hydrolase [Ferroacidibacillus organovorans]
MAIYELRFPELGEGLHEGRIEKWIVKPGDVVKEDDPIAEVENDKSMVELPSPIDGKVVAINVEAGTTVVVGDLILTFEVEGAAAESSVRETEQAVAEPVQASTQVAPAADATVHAAAIQATGVTAQQSSSSQEILAAPSVRKFARESGVFLGNVIPTGANGKILRADVERFLAGGDHEKGESAEAALIDPSHATEAAQIASVASDSVTSRQGAALEERVPLTTIRKLIAQAMVRSKHTAPHVTVLDEVDVTELVQLREELKPLAQERGTKITYLPFIVKALVAAIRRYPALNATLDEDRQELVLKKEYHIGIATDTERGLLVPVVRHADQKNMWIIAQEISELAARGRAGKLGPNEMKGSTISITNIGSAGGLFFTPIINYPEVAILGVGRITEKPVIKQGQIVPAHVMALSLSFDHRIIDGVLGQQTMNEIKRLLENPRLLLMEV